MVEVDVGEVDVTELRDTPRQMNVVMMARPPVSASSLPVMDASNEAELPRQLAHAAQGRQCALDRRRRQFRVRQERPEARGESRITRRQLARALGVLQSLSYGL